MGLFGGSLFDLIGSPVHWQLANIDASGPVYLREAIRTHTPIGRKARRNPESKMLPGAMPEACRSFGQSELPKPSSNRTCKFRTVTRCHCITPVCNNYYGYSKAHAPQ